MDEKLDKKDMPRWEANKRKYNVKYAREHTKKVCVQFYEKDYRYIEIWRKIPNKADWLKEQLDKYAKENGLD